MLKPRRFRSEKAVGPRGFSRWVQPNMVKYLMECCDCGLVHEMQFCAVEDSRGKMHVQFRARRAEAYTRQQRKQRHLAETDR